MKTQRQFSHQVNVTNFSLVLTQLAVSENCYDFLQATRLDICRYIVLEVAGSMSLLPLAVCEHEGLIVLCALHQVQSVLVLLLTLTTEACHDIKMYEQAAANSK